MSTLLVVIYSLISVYNFLMLLLLLFLWSVAELQVPINTVFTLNINSTSSVLNPFFIYYVVILRYKQLK